MRIFHRGHFRRHEKKAHIDEEDEDALKWT